MGEHQLLHQTFKFDIMCVVCAVGVWWVPVYCILDDIMFVVCAVGVWWVPVYCILDDIFTRKLVDVYFKYIYE
jgi:hypothetical protein